MRLRDVYRHKKYGNFIRISSFASPINKSAKNKEDLYVIVENLQIIDDNVSSCPSFNMYGTVEDIENNYELYRSADTINWDTFWDFNEELKKLIKEQEEKDQKELQKTFSKLSEEELKSLKNDINKIIAKN